MDKAYVQRQLKALKLQKFEENIRSLAQLWFSDDEKTVRTEVSDELENYALSGRYFRQQGNSAQERNCAV